MNKIIIRLKVITILFLFIVPVSYGQDTTYYTNDGLKLVSKEKADYYEVTKEKDNRGTIKEVSGYYISGKKRSLKTIILTNAYFVFTKKEKPIWSADGQYQEWFENGKLKNTAKFSKGNKVGEFRTYWENGKVKRKDNYEDDELPYEKFIEGKCFNESGKKIAYFPYYQPARFPGGPDSLKVFISRNIKNDQTDSLNTVNVTFYINKKGEISNVHINKKKIDINVLELGNGNGIETKMDKEVTRLILSMPNWNPALLDGELVGQYENKDIYYGKIFDRDGIYSVVQKMPEYKGGESALMQYISQNLKYPESAWQNKITGKVILQFVVTKTGSIGGVKVLRGISSDCDEEAIRVIKSLPDWIPGTLNGIPLNVYFTLPITFNLL